MPIPDDYTGHAAGINDPSPLGVAVTPDDDADLAFRTRGLWVGGTGDVAVQWPDGSDSIFVAVPAGTLLAIRVDRVLATGTDATNIVALK